MCEGRGDRERVCEVERACIIYSVCVGERERERPLA